MPKVLQVGTSGPFVSGRNITRLRGRRSRYHTTQIQIQNLTLMTERTA